jgi:hypothetical protein
MKTTRHSPAPYLLVFLLSILAHPNELHADVWYEQDERFQIDFGVDLSELVDTVALSAIYRF